MSHCVPRHAERGVALVVVMFVLIIVLAGGLAAVALTNGELSSTSGYRARVVTESCAHAAVDQIRKRLPVGRPITVEDLNAASADLPPITIGGTLTLTLGAHHVTGSAPAVDEVPAEAYDGATLFLGENATNALGKSNSMAVYRITATCEGAGFGRREVEVLVRLGFPIGG